jgi:hypothetical protein
VGVGSGVLVGVDGMGVMVGVGVGLEICTTGVGTATSSWTWLDWRTIKASDKPSSPIQIRPTIARANSIKILVVPLPDSALMVLILS